MTNSEKYHFIIDHNEEFLQWLKDENINVYDDYEIEIMYDENLDSLVDLPDLPGLHSGYANILEQLDPIAYRCGFNDFLDSSEYVECEYELFDGCYFESRNYSDEDEVIDAFIEYMEELNDDDEDEDEAEIEV